ncbi:MAG TPA: GNAT family N-acetyltransferase [Acidimicrobiales bacterium]|jgi:ribosomal protein S18 acetylase RimI-like enzyme|nr:GNAT family N-acetyltransferase [Acidimicrobiales bacterium]
MVDMNGSGSPRPAGGGSVVVSEATAVTPEMVEAFARLVPQLSSSSPAPTAAELEAIVSSPASVLLMASQPSGAIVGSLTLALFRVPTGVRAWIEDVVVDEAARGAGAGEALVMAALARADAEGAKSVDLTSRPSREGANRLYVRLGFETRQTNIYRYNAEHRTPT